MYLLQIPCIFCFLQFLLLEEQRQRLDFSVAALRWALSAWIQVLKCYFLQDLPFLVMYSALTAAQGSWEASVLPSLLLCTSFLDEWKDNTVLNLEWKVTCFHKECNYFCVVFSQITFLRRVLMIRLKKPAWTGFSRLLQSENSFPDCILVKWAPQSVSVRFL